MRPANPSREKYLKNVRVVCVRRGVYRLVHFPPDDHEDLVVVWLRSDLHQLSDALPAKAHLTLPAAWKSRRLRVPAGLKLRFADLDDAERAWVGAVQVTAPARTVANIDLATALRFEVAADPRPSCLITRTTENRR